MSLYNCEYCGERWTTHGTACRTTAQGSFAAPTGSATTERVKARMEGVIAALEARKLDANQYPEDSDLHFEWLAGWTGARLEMRKSPSDGGQRQRGGNHMTNDDQSNHAATSPTNSEAVRSGDWLGDSGTTAGRRAAGWDDDYDQEDDREDYYGDPRDESPLGAEGCVFPGECCMPGPHYESECHTMEMLMDLEREAEVVERSEPESPSDKLCERGEGA